jgi:hypothetical protein
MLVALADRHRRQDGDGHVLRQQLERAVEDALIDAGVDAQRQVRAVLLDRADRQQRDPPLRIGAAKLLRGHVLPYSARPAAHRGLPSLDPADRGADCP